MKIIIDDKIPFIKGVFEPFIDVDYIAGNQIDRGCLDGVDALVIRTRTKCNKKLLEGSKVKFIATATIGYDHIDVKYCQEKGIKWVNAPGCNANSVKQWFAMALLYYAKKNKIDLSKKTLGVIGVGHVGSKIVEVAEALNMSVLLNDPPRVRKEGRCGFVSLDAILRECDIITAHVPLNLDGIDKTFHLIDDSFLSKTNPGTVIINSSRGEVVDNLALLNYLNSGKTKDAILDVWENEPLINLNLLDKAAIATPHIAGYSFEGKANGTTMAVQAISKFFDLPLTDWSPEELEKEKEEIILDAKDNSFQSLCSEAISKIYSIEKDDAVLREHPDKFEAHRGNYPIRHEPGYYLIKLINGSDEISRRLKEIGFEVV